MKGFFSSLSAWGKLSWMFLQRRVGFSNLQPYKFNELFSVLFASNTCNLKINFKLACGLSM